MHFFKGAKFEYCSAADLLAVYFKLAEERNSDADWSSGILFPEKRSKNHANDSLAVY